MVSRLSAILAARQDTEHVMSANRTVFCLVMVLFSVLTPSVPRFVGPALLIAGLPVAALLFGHLLLHPEPHPARRSAALVVDLTTISLVMHFGDAAASCFYPLFLWVIFGNGIRFGLRDLAVATACGLAGFTAVVLSTPFWLDHPSLSIGLVAGTLIVPGYSSRLIRTLTEAREAAEHASRVKTTFLANISHDLRTPLQAVIGSSELLGTTPLTPGQAEMVESCLSAGQSLLHMVSGLLRFTQLHEAPTEPEISAFDPVDLVQHAIRVSAPICAGKGLTLSAHFSPSLPYAVSSDRSRLEEVLLNLISNAAKFTETGGILVSADPGGPDTLRFEVTDTGVGVSEAARHHIFDRFVQGDDTIRMRYGGSGMGLAICRELVSGLGGRIGLADATGHGSTFWFEVPVTAPLTASPATPTTTPTTTPPTTIGPRTSPDAQEPTPMLLLLVPGPVRDSFEAAAVREGRRLAAPGDDPPSLVVVAENPGTVDGAAEVRGLRAGSYPGQRRAVILVGGVDPAMVGVDPTWLSDVHLPQQCRPEQIHRALAISDAACRMPPRAVPVPAGQASSPATRVLIVDDNAANRLIFSRILSGGGYEWSTAVDGDQALTALEQETFDLVLMDVNMPVIDGLQATRLQRVAELGGPRIPIIGLTADGREERQKECLNAGMDACLTKPVTPRALLDAVRRLLDKGDPGRTAGVTSRTGGDGPPPLVDWTTLRGLDDIGGSEFTDEVLSEFERDALALLGQMEVAIGSRDVSEVRHLGHALASGASNVGAVAARQIGKRIETCSEMAIKEEGHELVHTSLGAVRGFLDVARSRGVDRNDGVRERIGSDRPGPGYRESDTGRDDFAR